MIAEDDMLLPLSLTYVSFRKRFFKRNAFILRVTPTRISMLLTYRDTSVRFSVSS